MLPAWEMGLGQWKDPDKGLGEMLAREISRPRIFLLILLVQLEGKHSTQLTPVTVIWLQNEIPRLPHSGWLTSP